MLYHKKGNELEHMENCRPNPFLRLFETEVLEHCNSLVSRNMLSVKQILAIHATWLYFWQIAGIFYFIGILDEHMLQ